MPENRLSKIEIGLQNERQALEVINRFGWLRPQEIGRYIWPGSKRPELYGDRMRLRLEKSSLVISRKLPRHCGTALLLSKKGAELLKDEGIDASTGKDIGSVDEAGLWTPRSTWKHDLLASSFLIRFRESYSPGECEVYSEYEIKNDDPLRFKVPDGIIKLPDNKLIWIEVEKSKKSGLKLMKMTDFAIKISRYGESVMGGSCQHVGLVYSDEAQDEKGHRIDHRLRLLNSFKTRIPDGSSINLTFFKVKTKSEAAISYEIEALTVRSNSSLQKAKRFTLIEKDEEAGWYLYDIGLPYHQAIIETGNDGDYNWSIAPEAEQKIPSHIVAVTEYGVSPTVTDAKLDIAKFLEAHQSR